MERQYTYLHQLEEKLNATAGQELVTREGKSYLADYPWFSDWMWMLYTIIFPALLFFISTVKISSEWMLVAGSTASFGLILNTALYALLAISIGLYAAMLHLKKPDKTAEN